MISYLRIVISLVIIVSIYGVFVPVLISMKDTAAVVSAFALALLAPLCIYAICKGLFINVTKENK